jgi:hypothetical protein
MRWISKSPLGDLGVKRLRIAGSDSKINKFVIILNFAIK